MMPVLPDGNQRREDSWRMLQPISSLGQMHLGVIKMEGNLGLFTMEQMMTQTIQVLLTQLHLVVSQDQPHLNPPRKRRQTVAGLLADATRVSAGVIHQGLSEWDLEIGKVVKSAIVLMTTHR
jgi:hypothetical protein